MPQASHTFRRRPTEGLAAGVGPTMPDHRHAIAGDSPGATEKPPAWQITESEKKTVRVGGAGEKKSTGYQGDQRCKSIHRVSALS